MKFSILLLLLVLPFYTSASKISLSTNYLTDCESWDYVEGGSIQGFKEAMKVLTDKAVEAGADTMYLDRVDVTPITVHDIKEPTNYFYTLYANTYVCNKKP